MIGIYKIENKVNGTVYIGKSHDIVKRWQQHIKSLDDNSHVNARLQKDWNNYKIDCFDFSVVKTCNKDELSNYEQYYIGEYFNSTNIYNSQIKSSSVIKNYGKKPAKQKKKTIKPKKKNQCKKCYSSVYIPKGIKINNQTSMTIVDKLILYMLQYVYANNDIIKIGQDNKLILSTSNFLKEMKTDSSRIYKDLIKINNLDIKINNINIIEEFSYKKGIIYLTLSKEGKKLLFEKSNYKKYNFKLPEIEKFSNKNSIKMLILLTQGNSKNLFSVDYLKNYFNANNNSYAEYSAFRVKYIQPMLKDLKSIGYNYTFEEIKFGRKVRELKFIKN